MSVKKETFKCSQCKRLETENLLLQKELSVERANYCQLLKESGFENFDRRRVNLLKAQILQLERQVALLSQNTLSYSELCSQVVSIKESSILKISSMTDHNKSDGKLVSELSSLKEDLMMLKIRTKGSIHCNVAYTGRYTRLKDLSLLDMITEGQSDITNISWLEGQVCDLFQYLVKLESSLRVVPTIATPTIASLDPVYCNAKMIHSLSNQCLQQCSLVSQELLTLSLLVPGQTQRRIRKNCSIDIKQLLNGLPPFSKNRQQGRELLESLAATIDQTHERLTSKVIILENELDHHKQLYSQQLQYFDTLFSMIGDGRREFIESLQESVGMTIKNIINTYDKFKTHDNIDNLLACLHGNVPILRETVQRLNEMRPLTDIRLLTANNKSHEN